MGVDVKSSALYAGNYGTLILLPFKVSQQMFPLSLTCPVFTSNNNLRVFNLFRSCKGRGKKSARKVKSIQIVRWSSYNLQARWPKPRHINPPMWRRVRFRPNHMAASQILTMNSRQEQWEGQHGLEQLALPAGRLVKSFRYKHNSCSTEYKINTISLSLENDTSWAYVFMLSKELWTFSKIFQGF